MDEISSVLNEGETLHTLADNFASIFVEATVNCECLMLRLNLAYNL